MGNVLDVSDATFASAVLACETPVLVDLWATWCAPCRMVAPVVEAMAQRFADRLRVVKLDVDANPRVAADLGVMGVPTLIIFASGRPVARVTGYVAAAKLSAMIEDVLNTSH